MQAEEEKQTKESGRVGRRALVDRENRETVGPKFVDNPRMTCRDVNIYYGEKHAIHNVSLDIDQNEVIAMIGPSGCGKSTFLRCLNRMNDTIESCRVSGQIMLDEINIYDKTIDVVPLRARVGMVFQKPNPFPKSIYQNIAYGPKIHGLVSNKTELDELVETSLIKAGLWEEVKDQLDHPGTGLSGRSTAAIVHCPDHRGQPRNYFDGRAMFGTGPNCHRQDRRSDLRAARKLLHRHCDPLHATGITGIPTHRIFPSWRPH